MTGGLMSSGMPVFSEPLETLIVKSKQINTLMVNDQLTPSNTNVIHYAQRTMFN